MQLLTKTNIDFVGRTRYTSVISIILILAGVVSLLMHGGPKLSIDFTGGTILQVKVLPAPELAQVRGALEAAGFSDFQVQDFRCSGRVPHHVPR